MKLAKHLTVISVLLLAACSTAPVAHKMNSVVFVDKSLNFVKNGGFVSNEVNVIKLTVDKHGSKALPSGSMEVWAVIKNHTDYDQEIQVGTQFYDIDQAPSEFEAVQQRMFITKNSTKTYRQTSVKQNMKFYRVEINGVK